MPDAGYYQARAFVPDAFLFFPPLFRFIRESDTKIVERIPKLFVTSYNKKLSEDVW